MATRTPDMNEFRRFFRHLNALDDVLCDFAQKNRFLFKRNIQASPSRVLLRNGNPQQVFQITAEYDWESIPDPIDLFIPTYAIRVISYYIPEGDGYCREKVPVDYRDPGRTAQDQQAYRQLMQHKQRLMKDAVLALHIPFAELEARLVPFLIEAERLLDEWSVPVLLPADPEGNREGWRRTRYWLE